jgi:hypothetical protein
MGQVRINNVRILDLLTLLAKMSLEHDAVDIILYPEERRVLLSPLPLNRQQEEPEEPSLDGEIRENDIEDIV